MSSRQPPKVAVPTDTLEVERLAPGVVRTKMHGHARLEHLSPIVAAVEAEIERGQRPEVFHDWAAMTGYDSDVRIAMTVWYRKVRDRVECVHVLTSSKLVAMGVSVVSLAVGASVESYTSRATFEDELARVTRGR